jgi:thioesterase domain-containing protein/acyl carrier protein
MERSMALPKAPSRAERPLIHVFEEVLGRTGIGPDQSFFDLGGDSLASVRAALRLEEVLGHEVPAGLLHQAPTARTLAAALQHAKVQPASHLSLLQPGGPGAPLFCMADLFGQPFNYLSLARELAPDRPVYGLAPGPLQDAFTADGDLDRLIASFKATVRGVQPRGPYLIAGYSVGGLMAAGLAAALERDGEAVRLVLLDSTLQSRRPSLGAIVARIARLFGSPRPPQWIPRGQLAFAARLIRVAAAYRPATVAGPALMVIARDRDPVDKRFDQDGMSGWSGVLLGDVTRTVVPGGHHQFLRAPDVAATARAVRPFLADGEHRQPWAAAGDG